MGHRTTTRGGNPYEKKQSETVARAAMEAMKAHRGEHPMVGQSRAKNVIADGERRMSISASKNREDPMGAYKNGGLVKGPRK
jgi:hypothetical protein